MTDASVKRLALILAAQAEIEGMKAENALRAYNGQSPAYGEDSFSNSVGKFHDLVYAHDDQL